ncbi:hypothetical protein ABBQ38_012445 [Trebouxia sp. C0009 RCD-2024]
MGQVNIKQMGISRIITHGDIQKLIKVRELCKKRSAIHVSITGAPCAMQLTKVSDGGTGEAGPLPEPQPARAPTLQGSCFLQGATSPSVPSAQGQELSGVERDQRKRYGTGPGDSGFELSACWQLH